MRAKKCSVCALPEAAEVANKMLDHGASLGEIAVAIGSHKSSVHRHATRCYIRAKAEKVRSNRAADEHARHIVCWELPNGNYSLTCDGQPFPAADFRNGEDVLIRVLLETVPPRNPQPAKVESDPTLETVEE